MVIEVSEGLEGLFRLYERQAEASPSAAIFDPGHEALSGGLWVMGRDAETGLLVHVQAIGVVELGHGSLRDYLEDYTWLYQPAGRSVETSLCFFPAPELESIGGRTCYHGDLWVRGGAQGYQGIGLAERLTRMMVHIAHQRYLPDAIWALMAERNVRTRFAAKCGYLESARTAAIWMAPNHSIELQESLVWTRAAELDRLFAEERDVDVLRGIAEHDEHLPSVRQPERRYEALVQ